ncbi:MAG: GH3 auxin-responsive promoter family protein [Planctomycetota bacterium]
MNPVVALLRALAGKVIVPRLEAKLAKFTRQLQDARRIQRELVLQKVRRCRSSRFGREHGFDKIHSIQDFRRQIPIATYEYYYPYIKEVTQGRVEAMFPAGEKLLMYTLSSGTTDDPKLIPINPIWMNEYRRGWQLWGIKAFLDHPELFYAKLNGIAGNWDMRRTPTDIPCGMASGLSARMQSPILRMMYCVPPSVYAIDDAAAKYYASLRLSVAEPAGLFLTATPATVVNFAKLGDRFRDTLIKDIADGTLSRDFAIPDSVRKEIDKKIRVPNPERARELEQIIEKSGHLYPKDYWKLSLVACWIGGTVGTYARHIPDFYGDAPTRDIGLLCSEGRFTIPIEDGTPSGALEILSHYYEFIPEDEIDSPQPTVLECHELEVGKSYFILLTTSSGLYRYNIQDVMRCTGFIGETPMMEFLHKGQRFSDMEGEKLSEYQFVKAVTDVASELGVSITGFTAVPVRPMDAGEENGTPPYYAILVEERDFADRATAIRFLEGIDRWLAEKNVMYQGKRADMYLGPLHLIKIPNGSWAKYDAAEVRRRNVGEDHYKHPCLVLDAAFLDTFPVIEEIVPPRTTLVA